MKRQFHRCHENKPCGTEATGELTQPGGHEEPHHELLQHSSRRHWCINTLRWLLSPFSGILHPPAVQTGPPDRDQNTNQ